MLSGGVRIHKHGGGQCHGRGRQAGEAFCVVCFASGFIRAFQRFMRTALVGSFAALGWLFLHAFNLCAVGLGWGGFGLHGH